MEHKILSLMNDTCNTANASARAIADLKQESLDIYFTKEEQAKLSIAQRSCLRFLCGNHTRQLPVQAYIRLVDIWLAAKLKPEMAKAQEKYPNARLETTSTSLIYSAQKLVFDGFLSYFKGDGDMFKAFLARCWEEEMDEGTLESCADYVDERSKSIKVNIGRSGVGIRQEGQLRASFYTFAILKPIIEYTNRTRGLEANILRDSVYLRASLLPNQADIHVKATMYYTTFDELMALTNHNSADMNPVKLAERYDELWVLAVMLQDPDEQFNIFDEDFRPFKRDGSLDDHFERRDKRMVEKAGPKTGSKPAPKPVVGPTNKPIAVSEKVSLWGHMGTLLREQATDANEDWDEYEPLLRECLTMFGKGIIESLTRTCSDFLTETDGDFAPDKVEDWMKAVAVHCLAHNNAAERPFAVVKFLNKKFPNMRLETKAGLTTAICNKTFNLGLMAGKTAKTKARVEQQGGVGSGKGAAWAAPPALLAAVQAVAKKGGLAAEQRREYQDGKRVAQVEEKEQRRNDEIVENERLAVNRAEKANEYAEAEMIESVEDLESRISACGTAGAQVKLLKAQVHARVEGKEKKWDYSSLPEIYRNGKWPKISTTAGTSGAVMVPYLTNLVTKMIEIDVSESRYEGGAGAGDEDDGVVGAHRKRQLPEFTSELISSQRKRHMAEDQRDVIEAQDDPQLVAYEDEFVGKIFETTGSGNGRKRSKKTVKIVAVEVNVVAGGCQWMVNVVACDGAGKIAAGDMTADGKHILDKAKEPMWLHDEADPFCQELATLRADIKAYQERWGKAAAGEGAAAQGESLRARVGAGKRKRVR